jgi:hypothetical protein
LANVSIPAHDSDEFVDIRILNVLSFQSASDSPLRPHWRQLWVVGLLALQGGRERVDLGRYAEPPLRMSSIERAEALVRLLDLDDAFRASRSNGYAYARFVDVEHAADMPPDALVLALDPLARLKGAYPDSPTPER